ncbi:uncharacterized protein MYCFIDRAFT_177549 [Pseudocercospora fijiensis CIRAD86]|uniref:Uncharacterized protein n=1 Tax=Pseudocercospora fijiensis (strain CIRAD86) TaxID=383855 RepID=M3AT01_PSEFD|nr:uncharacterized protein MYCFIDRAFT_177549 [Pseudocercospora fijiensis CIRAD86]EME80617.1 hypothetical protein MYCFIDRAFT_177549 [Pseudocercospora fijiensis CIRAD86]
MLYRFEMAMFLQREGQCALDLITQRLLLSPLRAWSSDPACASPELGDFDRQINLPLLQNWAILRPYPSRETSRTVLARYNGGILTAIRIQSVLSTEAETKHLHSSPAQAIQPLNGRTPYFLTGPILRRVGSKITFHSDYYFYLCFDDAGLDYALCVICGICGRYSNCENLEAETSFPPPWD